MCIKCIGGGISIEDGFGVTFLHYWISSSEIRIFFEYLSDIEVQEYSTYYFFYHAILLFYLGYHILNLSESLIQVLYIPYTGNPV